MPSRQPSKSSPPAVVLDPYSPSPSPNQRHRRHRHNQHESHYLLPPLLPSTAPACSFFFLVLLCFRKITRKRTTRSSDSESKLPYHFSYNLLRRATNSFSTRLGHGGFGPVFSGTLPSTHQPIAVKLMDSASLQGEREFHNELFFASRLRSPHVVSAIGFCSDGKRRRFLLVYELMQNGNMQDALLHKRCPELMNWNKRFAVIIDIAKAIHYLHSCSPPVIHGDIKPSNILLDRYFCAKIGDFGLARLKSESQFEVGILGVDNMGKMYDGLQLQEKGREEMHSSGGIGIDGNGSVIEKTESLNAGFEDGIIGVEQSPDGFVRIPMLETSPETNEPTMASPSEQKPSFQNGDGNRNGKGFKSKSVKDLWLKHDSEVASPNKKVKDYMMEWIGKDINKGTPENELVGASCSNGTKMGKNIEKKKSRKKLEWWAMVDEERNNNAMYLKKKERRRPAREWWKEECSQESAKKKKKKKKQNQRNGVHSDDGNVDDWWLGDDDDLYGSRKMRKNSSRNSRSSIDWWLDGLSGANDLWRARRNSYDSASGEIPKSGGITSTPSMRGTVFYVAPEYGFGEDISEKCDVYSFGVLLLVIISGRRPLQVTNSPLSEIQRANLLSWARHCARNRKLLDLVDDSVVSLDKEQALLCITVALLCLGKSPAKRPSMKEALGMLNGELEPPQLPTEYSPSPPSRFPFKSRQKGR